MHGPMTIRFIPVREGDQVEEPMLQIKSGFDRGKYRGTGTNHFLGFKPGRAGKREGWLIYGVHEDAPRSQRVVKRRSK